MALASPPPTPRRRQAGQVLLIDADDTLWENNLYFEQSIAQFISFLDHQVHTPAEVRAHLNRVERDTIASHGYGLGSFRASLTRCLEELLEADATPDQQARIDSFVRHIGDHSMELLDGVAATLGELAARHTLILVTKGNPEEQLLKLRSSGLAPHFQHAEVLAEKHEAAYRGLAERFGLAHDRTWMIGNSPKSDINPALLAGFNAVLIPHPYTWVLEHEPVAPTPSGQTLLELRSFRELVLHF